jgi:hypothetical protein
VIYKLAISHDALGTLFREVDSPRARDAIAMVLGEFLAPHFLGKPVLDLEPWLRNCTITIDVKMPEALTTPAG